MITTRQKLYIVSGLGAILLIGAATGSIVSTYRIGRLETLSHSAVTRAEAAERHAAELERTAASYREKIEYLEKSLGELNAAARRQDEKLQELNADTGAHRERVAAARRGRSDAPSVAELCKRLNVLGHPC